MKNLRNLKKTKRQSDEKSLLKDVLNYVTSFHPRQVIKTNIDPKVLKQATDMIYDKINAEVLFIVNVYLDKVTFICKSNGMINAGNLVKTAATLSKGSGGGKDTMAQGGTPNIHLVDDVILEIGKLL